MLNGNEILKLNPELALKETDDEMVVVLPDQGKYVVLNATGAKVIQLVDGEKTLTEVAVVISESFDEDAGQVLQDVLKFSEDMLARGILGIVGNHAGN
jgi:hypothetical protein